MSTPLVGSAGRVALRSRSLAAASALANIIAGYMLIYRGAFKVGDRITIGDVAQDVTESRLQVTRLDFAVAYELNAFCATPERMLPLYDALHSNILDVFNEYGVQIMTPAYERDPETPKVVPPSQWHLAPAAPVRAAGAGEPLHRP